MRAFSVAVALIAILSAVSSCRRSGCELPGEAERALNPNQAADREHLVQDLAVARRVAGEYGAEAAQAPVESNSKATLAAVPSRGPKATQYCESLLLTKIAATHHLTTTDLRALTPLNSER
jgi:hypothetical protein